MPVRILEQLHRQMRRSADAARCKIEFARLGLGERDQLLHVVRRQRRMRNHDQRRGAHQRDVGEVLERVVGQFWIEGWIDRMRRDDGAEGVAIGRGLGDHIGADDGVGARLVLEHDGLAERIGNLLADEAGHQIGVAARRVRHDHSDRPVRPVLRQGITRAGKRERQNCNGANRIFHDVSSPKLQRRTLLTRATQIFFLLQVA